MQKLIPSGCRVQTTRAVDATRNRFGYCTTMAIYVFDLNRFTLEKLIAIPNRSVNSFAWAPFDENRLATSSGDGTVIIWNIADEVVVGDVTLPAGSIPTLVDWCPQDVMKIAVLGGGDVFLWNAASGAGQRLSVIFSGQASTMRWCTRSADMLIAIGTTSGRAVVVNVSDRNRQIRLPTTFGPKDVIPVADVRWDPRSSTYLLVLFGNAQIILYDVDSCTVVMEFDVQKGTVAIAWNRNVPGEFFSCATNRTTLDVWNVSQRTPTARCKVGEKTGGALTMEAARQSSHLLISFVDGSTAVFNLDSRRLEYTTQPGHWETIFDCRFHPGDANILATGSFDGTIKLWNTLTGTFVLEMEKRTGCVYALAWDPIPSRLVSATIDGHIDLWDARTGALLHTFTHHSKACYRVAWNTRNPTQIVSTSSDCTAVIFNPDGHVMHVLPHPAAVYGCDFSQFNENLLVTGCHDGIVRVFDLTLSTFNALHELRGHRERVFNTVWSPLLKDTVASGSDDKTIRIWNLSAKTSVVLEGHHDKVRALVWNTEIPFLLVSGSWDSTIRVWDTRTQTCMTVIQDHQADIYGLATHAARPFTFASSSRDTSLRFWDLDQDVVTRIRIACTIDPRTALAKLRGTPDSAMALGSTKILCGTGSQELLSQLQAAAQGPLLYSYALTTKFLMSPYGIGNLWDLADAMVSGTPVTAMSSIQHVNHLASTVDAGVQQLQSSKSAAMGRGRRRELMMQCAEQLIQASRFEEYCQILVDLEEWERALAVAPAVSVPYWKDLSAKYAQHLADRGDDRAVAYWLASGSVEPAVELYKKVGDYQTALTVAVCSRASSPAPPPTQPAPPAAEPSDDSKRSDRGHVVSAIVGIRAQRAFESGESVLSACHHLSASQAALAVRKLIRGGEFLLALALARLLHADSVRDAASYVCRQAERLAMWDEVVQLWDMARLSPSDRAAVCARNVGQRDPAAFYKELGVRPPETFSNAGKTDTPAAVRGFVFAQAYAEAVASGVAILNQIMSRAHWGLETAWDIVAILHNVNAQKLDESQRCLLLCYCSYIGALIAKRRGLTVVAYAMFDNARRLAASACVGNAFPIDPVLIAVQQLRHAPSAWAALNLANDIAKMQARSKHVNEQLQQVAAHVRKRLETGHTDGSGSPAPGTNVTLLSGSQIPSARHAKFPTISMISGGIIRGTPFPLPDGDGWADRAEAMMWASVNPFSPLNTGARLNPF
ncbi:unnamed protein product (mitochondrion) [Plasmodiophora brassicae]|uniref:Anaphase-promoting complex subunit 4-like WD40 domain-containing protein n=1 Tax=Plasmodiophora brassicae TaxID=37360 RepID=A0A3P3YC88_PLABS|nr:unnamed protein product [Plasmodiophora brassicae]